MYIITVFFLLVYVSPNVTKIQNGSSFNNDFVSMFSERYLIFKCNNSPNEKDQLISKFEQ